MCVLVHSFHLRNAGQKALRHALHTNSLKAGRIFQIPSISHNFVPRWPEFGRHQANFGWKRQIWSTPGQMWGELRQIRFGMPSVGLVITNLGDCCDFVASSMPFWSPCCPTMPPPRRRPWKRRNFEISPQIDQTRGFRVSGGKRPHRCPKVDRQTPPCRTQQVEQQVVGDAPYVHTDVKDGRPSLATCSGCPHRGASPRPIFQPALSCVGAGGGLVFVLVVSVGAAGDLSFDVWLPIPTHPETASLAICRHLPNFRRHVSYLPIYGCPAWAAAS